MEELAEADEGGMERLLRGEGDQPQAAVVLGWLLAKKKRGARQAQRAPVVHY